MTLSALKNKIKAVVRRIMFSCTDSQSPTLSSTETKEVSENWLQDGYSWIPDWKSILENDFEEWLNIAQKSQAGSSCSKVLIATSAGGNSALTPFESMLGVALTLRGAQVHYILCDKVLPACQNCFGEDLNVQAKFLKEGPSICDWCYDTGAKTLGQLGLKVHKYSDFLNEEDRKDVSRIAASKEIDEILNLIIEQIDIGEIVRSAALRYFGRGDFQDEPNALPILQKYLESALLCNLALSRLYEKYKFDHTLSNQGIYIPQGNVVAISKKYGSHVSVWDIAYKKSCINISHDDTCIKTFVDEPHELWENLEWNQKTEGQIKEYLQGRWSGKFDWLALIKEGSDVEPTLIAKELGIDLAKPTIGLLTNVIWDAQLCYPNNAFSDQLEWLIYTIEYFKNRPEIQLVVRVHPAEVKSWIKSRQFAVDEIKKRFPDLPPNVFLIPPESKINTYKAMLNCNAVLIYGTTAGLEMACMGLPVIIAGQAWIRNKGIGTDVSSVGEYKTALDALPYSGKLSNDKWIRAMKYAYHFYLRSMIPVNVIQATAFENAPYQIKKLPLSGFAPGADEGLDVICGGILNRENFIYKYELKN